MTLLCDPPVGLMPSSAARRGVPLWNPARRTWRYDCMIIWGHGLSHRDEILQMIRDDGGFDILRIIRHQPLSLPAFVRLIYGTDTVPLEHLRAKTRYLAHTDPTVMLLFLRNRAPQEQITGEGAHRHMQCARVRELKAAIRRRFNPANNGAPGDDHVVHATDYESQVDQIIRIIGQRTGLAWLDEPSNALLNTPGHLPRFEVFRLRRIAMEDLRASILTGCGNKPAVETRPLDRTPHVAFCNGDRDAYSTYWQRYSGRALVNDHSPQAFDKLLDGFQYLAPPHESAYIVLRLIDERRCLILDGLHRAAILHARGEKHLIGAQVQ